MSIPGGSGDRSLLLEFGVEGGEGGEERSNASSCSAPPAATYYSLLQYVTSLKDILLHCTLDGNYNLITIRYKLKSNYILNTLLHAQDERRYKCTYVQTSRLY